MENAETAEIDITLVRKRSLTGVFSLITRSFFVQGIALASNFLLTIFLDPKTFGVFFLVSAFISFFSYFSDIGLAAALIQKKEKLDLKDLRTTFTVQQVLVLLLFAIIFILSPFVGRWYSLSKEGIWLFYALGISFFLSSLKTIPSILLERNLNFNLLVIPQIIETIIFNLVAVFLAWRGFEITSFTYAVLARGVVGLVAIYIISPWKLGFAFSKDSLKRLLRFGVPYQANTMMAVIKDDLMTIFLGKVIGSAGLGYLGWAKKWAEQPLRFFMDNVSKVAFPAFSRLQDDKQKLANAVEKSLFFLTFLTFPILIGFSVLASDLVKVIPRYSKWEPAILALYLYAFNSAWATVSTPLTNFLNATGNIKKTFRLMVMWLTLTWALMPVLGLRYGYNGVAVAASIISLSSVVAVIVARKIVKFDLVNPVIKPLAASLLMGVIVYFFNPEMSNLTLSIVFRLLVGGSLYFLFSYLFIGRTLFADINKVYTEFRNRKK
ncbi:oligosaccharide flippase family protein [Patescibacteria group bacterium]|nr:oligosaccharide flippase family protein [Patescibacteria group bacterium]